MSGFYLKGFFKIICTATAFYGIGTKGDSSRPQAVDIADPMAGSDRDCYACFIFYINAV
jgi:hypothetical protein